MIVSKTNVPLLPVAAALMYQQQSQSIVRGFGQLHVGAALPTNRKILTMHSPLEIVQRFYVALERGDVKRVLATLNDQIEWTEAERFPYYTGTWRGPQAVFENLLLRVGNDWNGFAATPSDFIVDGDRIVALGTYTGTYKKTGRDISVPFAHVWTVSAGTLLKFVQYTDTAKILDAIADPAGGVGPR
jgi:uncharacterized protein